MPRNINARMIMTNIPYVNLGIDSIISMYNFVHYILSNLTIRDNSNSIMQKTTSKSGNYEWELLLVRKQPKYKFVRKLQKCDRIS